VEGKFKLLGGVLADWNYLVLVALLNRSLAHPLVSSGLEQKLAASCRLQQHSLLNPAVFTQVRLTVVLIVPLANQNFAHSLTTVLSTITAELTC